MRLQHVEYLIEIEHEWHKVRTQNLCFGTSWKKKSLEQGGKNIVLFHYDPSYVNMGLNRKELQTITESYLLQIIIWNK